MKIKSSALEFIEVNDKFSIIERNYNQLNFAYKIKLNRVK